MAEGGVVGSLPGFSGAAMANPACDWFALLQRQPNTWNQDRI